MDKISLVLLTALICIPATAVITCLVLLRCSRSRSNTFRPRYIRRESAIDAPDRQSYAELEPYLERARLRLLPAISMQQIVRVKADLPQRQSTDAFFQLDGRTVQFLLVGTQNHNPLAVVHFGGDGSKHPAFEALSHGVRFGSAVFESVGIPEIVVLDKDMSDPARVAERIQEILRENKTGLIYV